MKKPKEVLLLGAGHSHIQVLHKLAKKDPSSFRLTLVSASENAAYSGMLPGFLAGAYKVDQIQFDLRKLSHELGFTFKCGQISKILGHKNSVEMKDGELLSYDVASINLGIEPAHLPHQTDKQILYVKPVASFIERWESFLDTQDGQTGIMNIVGGGAGAFEIAIACRLRFPNSEIRLFAGSSGLLKSFSLAAQAKAKRALKKQSIELIEGARVQSILETQILLSDERTFAKGLCLIAISPQAPSVFQNSDLPLTDDGYIKVNSKLQVEGFTNLFGCGDCAYFKAAPLAKAGVFAVRQGPVLIQNLLYWLEGQDGLQAFVPQSQFLSILITGHDRALASYGKFSFEGLLAWQLKNYIDKSFMKKFNFSEPSA